MCPSLADLDVMNCHVVNTSNDGQAMRRYSLLKQPSDVNDLFAGQLVRWLGLTAKIDKAGFPSMLSISRQTNPFEIYSSVVSLNTVNVVDAQTFFKTLNVRERNQLVQKNANPPPIVAKFERMVSRVVHLRSVRLLRDLFCHSLLDTISCSFVTAASRLNSDVSKVANNKRNVLIDQMLPNFHDPLLSCLRC